LQVHYWTHGRIGSFVLRAPMTLGHESSGIVHSVGSAVKSLSPGDRVALEPGVPCRRCEPCKSGAYNLCADMAFASTPPYDGTLCKYYALPADFCYKLPAGVSLEAGALVEPTAVAVHVVRQGEIKPGHSVVVFGAGPVGLLCAAVARGFGAGKVVVVDIVQKRLDFAQDWVKGGVGTYVPSKDLSAMENAQKLLEQNGLGDGADVVLEASGAPPSAQTAVWVARKGGYYVQAGMGPDDITFPIMGLCSKELTAKGSFRYKEGDYKLAVELIANGTVDAEKLISSKVSFDKAEEAFGSVKRGEAIKALIEGVKD
jgi:D-xylulose reductase